MPKVLAYVTQGEQLLVFRQPLFPELGVQVPGGSVEPGEALQAAVLREAREETGLDALELGAYLGSATYELKVDTGPAHLRHFFHLIHDGAAPPRWQHREAEPGSRGVPNRFELWWEPLASARLDWEMDAYLAALRQRLP